MTIAIDHPTALHILPNENVHNPRTLIPAKSVIALRRRETLTLSADEVYQKIQEIKKSWKTGSKTDRSASAQTSLFAPEPEAPRSRTAPYSPRGKRALPSFGQLPSLTLPTTSVHENASLIINVPILDGHMCAIEPQTSQWPLRVNDYVHTERRAKKPGRRRRRRNGKKAITAGLAKQFFRLGNIKQEPDTPPIKAVQFDFAPKAHERKEGSQKEAPKEAGSPKRKKTEAEADAATKRKWRRLSVVTTAASTVEATVDKPEKEIEFTGYEFTLPTTLKQVLDQKKIARKSPALSAVLVYSVLLAWQENVLPRACRWKALAAVMDPMQLITKTCTASDSPYNFGFVEVSHFDRNRLLQKRAQSAYVLRSYVEGTKPRDLTNPVSFALPNSQDLPQEYNNKTRKTKNAIEAVDRLRKSRLRTIETKINKDDKIPKKPEYPESSKPLSVTALSPSNARLDTPSLSPNNARPETLPPSVPTFRVRIRVIAEGVNTMLVLFQSSGKVHYPRGITLKHEYGNGQKCWQCADFWKLFRYLSP